MRPGDSQLHTKCFIYLQNIIDQRAEVHSEKINGTGIVLKVSESATTTTTTDTVTTLYLLGLFAPCVG